MNRKEEDINLSGHELRKLFLGICILFSNYNHIHIYICICIYATRIIVLAVVVLTFVLLGAATDQYSTLLFIFSMA